MVSETTETKLRVFSQQLNCTNKIQNCLAKYITELAKLTYLWLFAANSAYM